MRARIKLFLWLAVTPPVFATETPSVEMTWMSISNFHYSIRTGQSADVGIITDGYITRIPEKAFYGGGGGVAIARRVAPVLKPKVYIPVHWDGLWDDFKAGVTKPYSDAALEAFLATSGVKLIKPRQTMDKWRLDSQGVHEVANTRVKEALGFH